MNQQKRPFYSGLIHGIPIGLGYLAVSFTFGIMAVSSGLSVFQSVLISLTNLTSAGQFAGLGIITAGSSYLEMAAVQLVINLRYCLMSCSLSQKLDHKMPLFHRFLMAYGVTDEIFGVSVCHPGTLSPFYSYGLMSAAVPGWTLGTLLGALSGSLLPERLLNALGVALYGMFLAIIVPPARENRILRAVVLLSMTASFVFTLIPVLNTIHPDLRSSFDLCYRRRSRPDLPCKGGSLNESEYLCLYSSNGSSDLSDPTAAAHTDTKRNQKYLSSFFLYYVPYVTLSVMTFPAILYATRSAAGGAAALAVAVLLAWKGKSLFHVSLAACTAVFLLEFLSELLKSRLLPSHRNSVPPSASP